LIDALCIIQDGPVDWKYESSVMARVYRDAVSNLCALDSPDSRGGFLHPKSCPWNCIKFSVDDHRGTQESMFLKSYVPQYSEDWVKDSVL
jgi:hypothetical protein